MPVDNAGSMYVYAKRKGSDKNVASIKISFS